jgi:hypothetical protein
VARRETLSVATSSFAPQAARSREVTGLLDPGSTIPDITYRLGADVIFLGEEDGAADGSLFGKSEHFSDFPKKVQKIQNIFGFFGNSIPNSVGDISVTSELDSESLTTLRKIFLSVVGVSS